MFVEPDDGSKDAFVHISTVARAGLSSFSEEQKVSYEPQPRQNGKSSAENLSIIDQPRKAPSATPVRRPPRAAADTACIDRLADRRKRADPRSFLRQQ